MSTTETEVDLSRAELCRRIDHWIEQDDAELRTGLADVMYAIHEELAEYIRRYALAGVAIDQHNIHLPKREMNGTAIPTDWNFTLHIGEDWVDSRWRAQLTNFNGETLEYRLTEIREPYHWQRRPSAV